MSFNLKIFIVNSLRRASYRMPQRTKALKDANRGRNAYECAACKKIVTRKEVQIDHIHPIVPLTGWDSWDGYIARLFCEADALQVLCRKPCHHLKTVAENKLRRNRVKLDTGET